MGLLLKLLGSKVVLILLGIFVVVGGFVLTTSGDTLENEGSGSNGEILTSSSLNHWGEAAIRLGATFSIAIIAGIGLRAFFKTAVGLILLIAFVLWLLSYHEIIDPFWQDYRVSSDGLVDWFRGQTQSLVAFFRSDVTFALTAIIGLLLGLRR